MTRCCSPPEKVAGGNYRTLFAQNQPALMLFSDDIKADCDRITACGGKLTMPPTDVTASTIAQVEDGCGNLVQITQLKW